MDNLYALAYTALGCAMNTLNVRLTRNEKEINSISTFMMFGMILGNVVVYASAVGLVIKGIFFAPVQGVGNALIANSAIYGEWKTGIIFLYIGVTFICTIGQIVIFALYDLDDKMPQIRKEIENRSRI